MTAQEYEERLERVVGLLEVKPRTALEIQKAMRCSKPAAYGFIEALRARGFAFSMEYVRQAKRGPAAARFKIRKDKGRRAL